MKYLVVYDGNRLKEISAENIEDCIIQFADWAGDKTELLLKALKGCDMAKEYVDIYEHLGNYTINFIFLLQDTIYKE
ncbi:MAG TPA: hypothetical protein DCW90_20175 [Lachnospiraceae bacterium]|nr:hypothetical protein [Lachnospiraceae bacterium]